MRIKVILVWKRIKTWDFCNIDSFVKRKVRIDGMYSSLANNIIDTIISTAPITLQMSFSSLLIEILTGDMYVF